jgi:ammonia channel protein AmtB
MRTNLAAVAGAATAMTVWYFLFGKPDISMACNGMLAGLVAITAPCAFVGANAAVLIGILAGIVVCCGVLFNERVIKVDDPCGCTATAVGLARCPSASSPTGPTAPGGTASARRATSAPPGRA